MSLPDHASAFLELLAQYGWEMGLERLDRELQGSAAPPALRALFVASQAAERGRHDVARAEIAAAERDPELADWCRLLRAFVAHRERAYAEARRLLDEVQAGGFPRPALEGVHAHLTGSTLFREGRGVEAVGWLRRSAEILSAPTPHFLLGRTFDSLGMVYAARDDFHAARRFYEAAVDHKRRFNDRPGLALSHGNLGRLYLDWGYFDKAARAFETDLELSQRLDDRPGQVQMRNDLGRTALAQAEIAPPAQARRHRDDARLWLAEAVRSADDAGLTVAGGFARKDLAAVLVALDEFDEADRLLAEADRLFAEAGFTVGRPFLQRGQGELAAARGDFHEAFRLLHAALDAFDGKDALEAGRTKLALARVRCKDPHAPAPERERAYLGALDAAERSRRPWLVALVEGEMRDSMADALALRLYRRVRGRAIADDSTSLMDGRQETATVLFLDVKGYSKFSKDLPPREVMETLNQLMADLRSSMSLATK
ncbi:MAG: tetratricopeptide repeat protein [Planctomycetia bacterium]